MTINGSDGTNTLEITIPGTVKKSFFLLFPYITVQLVIANFRSLIPKLVLGVCVLISGLSLVAPSFDFRVWTAVFGFTALYLVVVPAYTALEECLHIGVCVQLGKSDAAKGVMIGYIGSRPEFRLFVNSFVTKFQGIMTLPERIRIHGAAPLLILLLLVLSFCLVTIYTAVPGWITAAVWIFLAIPPIGSLIPHRLVTDSDGYSIMMCSRALNYSPFDTTKELIKGVALGLRYIIIGSCCAKRSEIRSDMKGELEKAFEAVQNGDLQGALVILERQIEGQPDNPELLNNIAWCYAEIGADIRRAIELAEKALALDPTEAPYHDTLGWCYYKSGDIDRALNSIRAAVEIEPENAMFEEHLDIIEREKSSG